MAWNEIVDKRGRGTKVFRDSVNPAKHSLDSQVGTAWHYPSVLDSGIYDTEVDLTPERILALGHDGWRVTNNGWHYFLGQPNGLADGFVGFGGRQGDKWLLFRLARVGYIHWPTRAWQDIGGAPTYDRANLSQQTNNVTINTTGQTIPVETVATWSDIWNTPGDGALDVSWRVDGNRLKEEITINQEARAWIAANRPPTTAPADTYLSFVFRLGSAPDVNNIVMDLSYLPRWLKDGVLQDCESDFDDDDGTQAIEVRNALDEFLFLLPVSDARVGEETIKLRKRIYKDGSDYYLLVGAKVTDIVGLPAGDLVFDPTVDETVGSEADDYFWLETSSTYGNYLFLFGNYSAEHGPANSAARFDSVDIGSGSTIDVSYVRLMSKGDKGASQIRSDIFAVDSADPAAATNYAEADGQTNTTAFVVWDFTRAWNDANDYDTPSLNTVIQELANSYDYTGGKAIIVCIEDGGTAEGILREAADYGDSAINCAQLHIEYTAAAAPPSKSIIPMVMHHRKMMGVS